MPRAAQSKPPLTEKQVRRAVIRRLSSLFGANCYWVSNSPGPYGHSGRPDLEVCPSAGAWRGRFVAIELKAERYGDNPSKGLTAEQRETLNRIAKAGGIAVVVNTPPYPHPSSPSCTMLDVQLVSHLGEIEEKKQAYYNVR